MTSGIDASALPEMDDDSSPLAPVHLERIKGARVVYHRQRSRNLVLTTVYGGVVAVTSVSCLYVYFTDPTPWDQILPVIVSLMVLLLGAAYQLLSRLLNVPGFVTCDHEKEHDCEWGKSVNQMNPGSGIIEAGTVVNWGVRFASGVQKFHGETLKGDSDADEIVDHLLEVLWDCGHQNVYYKKRYEWNFLRVFDMGPAGILLAR